ncbi:MAG: protein translocase subunit SecDF [Chitinophagales bacterium]
MQAKGLVKFFGIALVLVCLIQLSFTFIAKKVEGDAKDFALAEMGTTEVPTETAPLEQYRIIRRQYLDSMSTEQVYPIWNFTYKDVKERELNLGLDLQGGMSVVLQVSLEELVRAMANNSTNATFTQAIAEAKEKMKSDNRGFVTLFGESFEAIDGDARLASIFSTVENQGIIAPNDSNEAVLAAIQTEADDAVNRTFEILRARIDKFGVTQPNINLLAATNRIVVELPGVDDPERVRKLLQTTAQLEFWETFALDQDLANRFAEADRIVKDRLDLDSGNSTTQTKVDTESDDEDADTAVADAVEEAVEDTIESENSLLANADKDTTNTSLLTDPEGDPSTQNPFLSLIQFGRTGSAILGYVEGKDTAKLFEYLKIPEVRTAFPENFKLLVGAKAAGIEDNPDLFEFYGIKSRYGNNFKAPMEGDVITDARQDNDYNQQIVVSMDMNPEGAKKWKQLTRENLQKSVAIVLDNQVYSAPVVQAEIGGGRSQITGNFDVTEAQDLANVLKAGKLPAKARIVEEAIVGPSLGQRSINASLTSLIVGMVLVLIFMIFYYGSSGVVANLALIANLFFVIGILASLGATLTLPGMAGIVLTIGMAVDANVIIFERIREELARGSGLRKAIHDGYTKSYSAIIDANLTTLITAAILYYFGLGPVLGFATVLIIGIFSSLFTAILLTRLIIDWWLAKGKEVHYSTKMTQGMFKNLDIDFVNRRKITYILSGVLIVIGLISFATKGFELGVDFKGGWTYVVDLKQDMSNDEVRNALDSPLEGESILVRDYDTNTQKKITTSYLIGSDDEQAGGMVEAKLFEGLKSATGATSLEDFQSNYIQSSQKVGPTIADDITRGAYYATIFALLGIFLYIVVRFRRWQFGLAAVLTIIHDTLILLTLFSIFPGILPFSMEIDQNFIAALLTVIGYSFNDTVVVFDRIREYLQLRPKDDEKMVINDAINSTLSRTIITSLTTLLVVLILFIFGGEVIQGFAFALLVGIIVGTYSSIFVATPLVVDLSEYMAKRKAAQMPIEKSRNNRRGKGRGKKGKKASTK